MDSSDFDRFVNADSDEEEIFTPGGSRHYSRERGSAKGEGRVTRVPGVSAYAYGSSGASSGAEDDVYSFDIDKVSARKKGSTSGSSRKSRSSAAKKVSKLQPQSEKDSIKASAEKSYNDRIAAILARTRQSAEQSSASSGNVTPLSVTANYGHLNLNNNDGMSPSTSIHTPYTTINAIGTPTNAIDSTGHMHVGSGVFADFAKSIRDIQITDDDHNDNDSHDGSTNSRNNQYTDSKVTSRDVQQQQQQDAAEGNVHDHNIDDYDDNVYDGQPDTFESESHEFNVSHTDHSNAIPSMTQQQQQEQQRGVKIDDTTLQDTNTLITHIAIRDRYTLEYSDDDGDLMDTSKNDEKKVSDCSSIDIIGNTTAGVDHIDTETQHDAQFSSQAVTDSDMPHTNSDTVNSQAAVGVIHNVPKINTNAIRNDNNISDTHIYVSNVSISTPPSPPITPDKYNTIDTNNPTITSNMNSTLPKEEVTRYSSSGYNDDEHENTNNHSIDTPKPNRYSDPESPPPPPPPLPAVNEGYNHDMMNDDMIDTDAESVHNHVHTQTDSSNNANSTNDTENPIMYAKSLKARNNKTSDEVPAKHVNTDNITHAESNMCNSDDMDDSSCDIHDEHTDTKKTTAASASSGDNVTWDVPTKATSFKQLQLQLQQLQHMDIINSSNKKKSSNRFTNSETHNNTITHTSSAKKITSAIHDKKRLLYDTIAFDSAEKRHEQLEVYNNDNININKKKQNQQHDGKSSQTPLSSSKKKGYPSLIVRPTSTNNGFNREITDRNSNRKDATSIKNDNINANNKKKSTAASERLRQLNSNNAHLLKHQQHDKHEHDNVDDSSGDINDDDKYSENQDDDCICNGDCTMAHELKRELEYTKAEVYALKVQLDAAIVPDYQRILSSVQTTPNTHTHTKCSNTNATPIKKTTNSSNVKTSLSSHKKSTTKTTAYKDKEVIDIIDDATEGLKNSSAQQQQQLQPIIDAMTAKLKEQEILLAGFQKENDKLVQQIKQIKDTHEKERYLLYREREKLNTELITLKGNEIHNTTTIDTSIDHIPVKTVIANTLHARLDAEAKTVLAIEQANDREIQLKNEINKLKTKVNELAQFDHTSETTLQSENDTLKSKIETLQNKLEWYMDNQQLVDKLTNKIHAYENTIASLRKGNNSIDTSRASKLTNKKGISSTLSVSKSSTADAKRIKELEDQLRELENAVRKRNPDSISNLIRAIKPSESLELQQSGLNQKVQQLELELERVKNDSDMKIRSLRQQHEKVCMGLEKRLQQQSQHQSQHQHNRHNQSDIKLNILQTATNNDTHEMHTDIDNTNNTTVEQLKERINELELEVTRIRAFYTKKVKDVERRYETQLRAFKRGNNSTAVNTIANEGTAVYGVIQNNNTNTNNTLSSCSKSVTTPNRKQQQQQQDNDRIPQNDSIVDDSHDDNEYADNVNDEMTIDHYDAAVETQACSPTVKKKLSDKTKKIDHKNNTTIHDASKAKHSSPPKTSPIINKHNDRTPTASNAQHQHQHEHKYHTGVDFDTDAIIASIRLDCQKRVAILEQRLMDTANQLGKAQAQAQAHQWSKTSNNSNNDNSVIGTNTLQIELQQMQLQQLKSHQEITELKSHISTLISQLERSEEQKRVLESEVSMLKHQSLIPSTPSAVKVEQLTHKLHEMEKRVIAQDTELHHVLEDARRNYTIETNRQQALHAEELREKEEQIDSFRCELDMVLTAAHIALTNSNSSCNGNSTKTSVATPCKSDTDHNATDNTIEDDDDDDDDDDRYGLGY